MPSAGESPAESREWGWNLPVCTEPRAAAGLNLQSWVIFASHFSLSAPCSSWEIRLWEPCAFNGVLTAEPWIMLPTAAAVSCRHFWERNWAVWCFFPHSFSCRAMEVPAGPSAEEESSALPAAAAVTSESQPTSATPVQITVLKAQDLVEFFWKCLCWFNKWGQSDSVCRDPIRDQVWGEKAIGRRGETIRDSAMPRCGFLLSAEGLFAQNKGLWSTQNGECTSSAAVQRCCGEMCLFAFCA